MLSKEQFVENVNKKGNAPDIEIIGEYVSSKTKIFVRCIRCNTEFYVIPSSLYKTRCCMECSKRTIHLHYGAIKPICDTNPELANFLLNKEDGKKYSKKSCSMLWWKCPQCGEEFQRSPNKMRGVFSCKRCRDGYSLPNKMCYNILKYLQVPFVAEKTFEWSRYSRGSRISYDFYLLDINSIIEMQGGQHYPSKRKYFNKTYEEIHKDDIEKEDVAVKHGICKYYKIDARISSFDFIKHSIINSLKNVFDLSRVDWNLILKNSSRSIIKDVCDYYNNHNDSSMGQIEEYFSISNPSLRRYLTTGNNLGFCDYNPRLSFKRSTKFRLKHMEDKSNVLMTKICEYANENPDFTSTDIAHGLGLKPGMVLNYLKKGMSAGICNYDISRVYKIAHQKADCWRIEVSQYDLNGNFIKNFNSIKEASKPFSNCGTSISNAVCGRRKTAFGFFWKKIEDGAPTQEEINAIKPRSLCYRKPVLQYTSDDVFVKEYGSVEEAERQTKIHGITSAINNLSKMAGGYIWKCKENIIKD